MIVARHFGWEAVSGRDRMSHEEFLLAVQLLAEERYGTQKRTKNRQDDATRAKSLEALRK